MRLHKEIIKSTIASISVFAITFWIFGIEWRTLIESPLKTLDLLVLGTAFYILFEYGYHRFLLHIEWRVPILNGLYEGHREHHQSFHGNNLTSRDILRHKGTVTSWNIFPILFLIIFFAFIYIFPHPWAFPFFLSITFCFNFFYQIAHHLTHIGDNAIDRFIIQKTALGPIRQRQINNHLEGHHRKRQKNLNFFPECPADIVFGTHEK
ncbi:MAG: hypothetical protein AAB556_02065 [Patescibacteria group bacterium]